MPAILVVYALYNSGVCVTITTSSFNVLMIVFVVVTHKLHYTVCVVHRLFATCKWTMRNEFVMWRNSEASCWRRWTVGKESY